MQRLRKKKLLFGYKESETNLPDLLITNLSVFMAKTPFFFPTEQYADLQNIFLGKKKPWATLRKHYATEIMVKSDLFSRREITAAFIGQDYIFREAPTKPTKENKAIMFRAQ